MENNQNTQNNDQTTIGQDIKSFFRTTIGKILAIFTICIVLLIPFHQLGSIFYERSYRYVAAKTQVQEQWGNTLNYEGVYLRVPYKNEGKNKNATPSYYYFSGIENSNQLNVQVNKKNRGIFNFPVYTANIHSYATFNTNGDARLDWEKCQVGIIANTSNPIQMLDKFDVNGSSLKFLTREFTSENQKMCFYSSVSFPLNPKSDVAVKVHSIFQGSEYLMMKAQGKKHQTTLTSNWGDPSFQGNLLPDPTKTKISENSSKAQFVYVNPMFDNSFSNQNAKYSSIRFSDLSGHYILYQRTTKYAAFIILLTFAVFFISETLNKKHLHVLHYLMIGLVLYMFYGLLLAISEHLGFLNAYLIASLAVVLVVIWYTRSILLSTKFGIVTGTGLSVLYALLLLLIHLESFAFLVGMIALFLILVIIMSLTKRLLRTETLA